VRGCAEVFACGGDACARRRGELWPWSETLKLTVERVYWRDA
jgi:hypothetical protein